jgi:hypothetical protein
LKELFGLRLEAHCFACCDCHDLETPLKLTNER